MTRPSQRLWAVPALLLVFVAAVQSAALFKQNLLFTRAETELSFWGRTNYQPTQSTINHTVQTINTLLQHAPQHPNYLSQKAYAHAWQAYWAQTPQQAAQHATQALSSQQGAMQSRPAHPQSQRKMLEYRATVQSLEN